ncbi:hypothetical protein CN059_15190 [Sinorhizobium medicae]|nr:hypothetical protein CN059_15190 [Sinorhizobium medicae]
MTVRFGRREPFFTSPVHGLLRGCSRSGPKISHNVSSGTRARWPVSSPICLRVICIHWEKAV